MILFLLTFLLIWVHKKNESDVAQCPPLISISSSISIRVYPLTSLQPPESSQSACNEQHGIQMFNPPRCPSSSYHHSFSHPTTSNYLQNSNPILLSHPNNTKTNHKDLSCCPKPQLFTQQVPSPNEMFQFQGEL